MSPIVLASSSATRARILTNAGVDFTVMPALVEESAVKIPLLREQATALAIAERLAVLKALTISRETEGLVIGADQTLEFEGIVFDKATTADEAETRLRAMRGRTHSLHTAVAVARDGEILWQTSDGALMTMRLFSDDFLSDYMLKLGSDITRYLGCYQYEIVGVQLFKRVSGDYFTILGLPLLGLLEFLRSMKSLPS